MEQIQLILTPEQSAQEQYIKKAVAKGLHLPFDDIEQVRIIRRSVDARQRDIRVILTVEPQLKSAGHSYAVKAPVYKQVDDSNRRVVIVGAGPAGLFAALTLLEHGIKPVIIERGKRVSERKKDIALLNRNEGLNQESNYCFGEGGAGTFSDGKLFSRSKKRGDMQRVMELFHFHGADERVLYETHAHIGSDRLPRIISNIRECIITHGGEIHFDECLTDILISGNDCKGIRTDKGNCYTAEAVILAIGHSAHDTYKMLHQRGILLQPKGFAMGVRVEHPQSLINELMYHLKNQPADVRKTVVSNLGNASYSLVTQVEGRGVYSFCMCPGGHIVPATSSADCCVVNGMSASHRNSPYANSGIVVEIRPEDISGASESNPLAGLLFQEHIEQLAALHGAYPSKAPAQRLRDFVEGRKSKDLPTCSYLPGVVSSNFSEWLPATILKRLQRGFIDFDRKYKGFLTNDAVVLGVESRSSSPVRIPRDRDTMQHTQTRNLYPCGEGAGYAGGITSSALDGINAALAICHLNL